MHFYYQNVILIHSRKLGIQDALALSTNVKLSKDCDLFQRSGFSSKKWGNEPWNSTSKNYRFYLPGGLEPWNGL